MVDAEGEQGHGGTEHETLLYGHDAG